MDKVAAILNDVGKRPPVGNKEYVKKLIAIIQSQSEEESKDTLTAIYRGCLDKCLVSGKKEVIVDKMTKFLVLFVSSSIEVTEKIWSSCIEHLLERSKAVDKIIRFRSCQIISYILKNLGNNEVSEKLLDNVITVLTPRLRDKAPNVRIWAIKSMDIFQSDDKKIESEIIRLMQTDSSKDVRVAAIEILSLSKENLPFIVDRIKDVKPEVRIAVFEKLSLDEFNTKHLVSRDIGKILSIYVSIEEHESNYI